LLDAPRRLDPSQLITLETLSKTTTARLYDSFSYAWFSQAPEHRHNLAQHGRRTHRAPLAVVTPTLATLAEGPTDALHKVQRLRQQKLHYLTEVLLPQTRLELVHLHQPRVRSICDALAHLQTHPRLLDGLRGTDPRATIHGVLCDLALLPNPRLARLLSLKRASAMTSVVTKNIGAILETKKRMAQLRVEYPDAYIAYAQAFMSADTPTSSNVSGGGGGGGGGGVGGVLFAVLA